MLLLLLYLLFVIVIMLLGILELHLPPLRRICTRLRIFFFFFAGPSYMELRARCSSDVAAVKRTQDTTNRSIMNLKFAVFYFSEVII